MTCNSEVQMHRHCDISLGYYFFLIEKSFLSGSNLIAKTTIYTICSFKNVGVQGTLNINKQIGIVYFVICLFYHEQIYTYMFIYTQGLSTQKLQCSKLVVKTYCFVITFEIQS
jgi:hypothetical protein